MKILKPGKVEQRKFVCPRCGCSFVASYNETKWEDGRRLCCPYCGKTNIMWNNGETYREPTPTQTDRERLARILLAMPVMNDCNNMANYLIQRGVTFREG